MPQVSKITGVVRAARVVKRVVKTVKNPQDAVKLEPKLIKITDAQKCCEQTQVLMRTEAVSIAKALAQGIFEQPTFKAAPLNVRLDLSVVLMALLKSARSDPEIVVPPPLRVILPSDSLGTPSLEAEIPADPTFETFSELFSATMTAVQSLARARSKRCANLVGLNPNRPRHWKPKGRNTRKT